MHLMRRKALSSSIQAAILRIRMVETLRKDWRTIIASVFSVVLIAGSYLFAQSAASPLIAEASPDMALLQVIAAKDSSGDGLPDWEKVLYGIPVNATTTDYFHLGMTDGEAVARGLIVPKAIADITTTAPTPSSDASVNYAAEGLTPPAANTLTDAFAKDFFSMYLIAKKENGGSSLSSSQTDNLASQVISQLSGSFGPKSDFKSIGDLRVSGSGPEALRSFAVSAEAVLKKNGAGATKSDLQYLQDAVQNNDATALTHLADLAKAYRNSAIGLAVLPVPQELAETDLAIVNAIMRLGEIYSDFSRVNVDPLAAMLALQQYSQAETNAEQAFIALFNTYRKAGVTLLPGEAGALFVDVMPIITAEQQSAK